MNNEATIDHDELEEAYRRGYYHGYDAALRDPTKMKEVKKWRYDYDFDVGFVPTTPPASHFPEGTVLQNPRGMNKYKEERER